MIDQFNFWKFLAGLGVFMLGMQMIEHALSELAGRSFKSFLRKYTSSPFKAIVGGTAVTAVLQSSSIVSLMVLAFVGTGIIELQNAVGVIIGSNLGTTFTGWVVAIFGFEVDIENFALPFLAIGGLGMVFFTNKEKVFRTAQFIAGLGFLFMGLEFMKSSIVLLADQIDLSPFLVYGPYLLFIIGFIITAIIQSSSATMVIVLSALSANIITFPFAAAMIIGSDLGTTITTIFGSMAGSAGKRRVALSHFLFNVLTGLIGLILLYPLINFITYTLNVKSPLISLVAFHSIFNLLGIIVFFPFIKLFSRFLSRRFTQEEKHVNQFIKNVPIEVPDEAIEALNQEVVHLLKRVFQFHLRIIGIDSVPFQGSNKLYSDINEKNISQQYETIKELEGELIAFYLDIQNQKLDRDSSSRLNQLILATRYAMTSAKTVKDINHNFKNFERSVNEDILKLVATLKIHQQMMYFDLFKIFDSKNQNTLFEEIAYLKKKNKIQYDSFLEKSYQQVQNGKLGEIDTSTILNVNREIYNANKALLQATKEIYLNNVSASNFDEMPSFD